MDWIKKWSLALVLVLAINHEEGVNAARILGIFPFPLHSHFLMAKTLLKGLAARGHQVDVISHFPLEKPPKNYHDISLNGTIWVIVNNLTLANIESCTGISIKETIMLSGNELCRLYKTPQIRNIVENPPNDPPYDLVITELFVADCYLAMGRHLKVPIVGIFSSKMLDWTAASLGNPTNTAFVPNVYSRYSPYMNFYERLKNTILSKFVTAEFWYYHKPQLQFVNNFFGFELSSLSELYKDVAVALVNTHPTMDSAKPMTPGIVEVAGMHVTDDDEDLSLDVRKWLDESNAGFIYFSFGSMVKIESFPKQTMEAFYIAMECIAPVRVLMKIAKKDELPAGLPKNVMTSSWFPQIKILKHKNIKAFINHGGLMSNIEAVTYGVPMVSIPICGDQHINARYNEHHHIGITVDYRTITANSFTKILKTILTDKSYSKKAKQVEKLFIDRPLSALDTGIYWVEYAIRNGNVLRSPAAELSWYQVELLDVYGFLLVVFLLALYVIKQLLNFVFNLLICHFGKQPQVRSSAPMSKKNK